MKLTIFFIQYIFDTNCAADAFSLPVHTMTNMDGRWVFVSKEEDRSELQVFSMWVKSWNETCCWLGACRVRWSNFPHCCVIPEFYMCFQELFALTDNLNPKLSALKQTEQVDGATASYLKYTLWSDWWGPRPFHKLLLFQETYGG